MKTSHISELTNFSMVVQLGYVRFNRWWGEKWRGGDV